MRKFAFLVVLSVFLHTVRAFTQEVGGDWVGQLNGGFTVRIHLEKSATGYGGHLTNPSGNETGLDQVTCEGNHLHFGVNKLNLSYDGVWDEKEKDWNGRLTFQQVYPLILNARRPRTLRRMTTNDRRKRRSWPNPGPIPREISESTMQPAITTLPEH